MPIFIFLKPRALVAHWMRFWKKLLLALTNHTFSSRPVHLDFSIVSEIQSDDKSLFDECVQLWAAVCCCSPQDQETSGEELQESFWRRIPTLVSPWERTKSSGSSCATTAGVNLTSTRSASASGNATMATFTGELWKEPGHIISHPLLSSRENWRCLPETDETSSESMAFYCT